MDQLDLFFQPKKDGDEQPKPKWPGMEIVVDNFIPKGEIHVRSGESHAKIINVDMPKEYGDMYLAKGIARWSVYCFLWLSENGNVCAPQFGDSIDVGWRARWTEIDEAKEMLDLSNYTPTSSMHYGLFPGTVNPGKALAYRYPSQGIRDEMRKEAKATGVDKDLYYMPTVMGKDGPEAYDFYKLLRAMRRSSESDDTYRIGIKRNQDVTV